MSKLRPEDGLCQLWHRPVLLLAGFPSEDDEEVEPERLLEIEEALLSFARATLAVGRRIIVPADRVVAPLLAQVAGEYAPSLDTEREDDTPPLVGAIFTGGRDRELELMLTEGGRVEIARFGAAEIEEVQVGGSRHRLTPEALAKVDLARAVVIGEPPALLEELQLVRETGGAITTFGPTLSERHLELGELREQDVVRPLLGEVGWERDPKSTGRQTPYPFLMQELVSRWGDEYET